MISVQSALHGHINTKVRESNLRSSDLNKVPGNTSGMRGKKGSTKAVAVSWNPSVVL